MARINTNQLVAEATAFADRVDRVQRDPAVRKAWNEAREDVTTALGSIKGAADETRAAWRRTDTRGLGGVAGAYA